jgi:hypothetical protein
MYTLTNPTSPEERIIEEWRALQCEELRAKAAADPNHFLNRQMAEELITGPVYRGMKVRPDDRLLNCKAGELVTLPPSSFSRLLKFASLFTKYSMLSEAEATVPVMFVLQGRHDGKTFAPFHGIDVNRHVGSRCQEVIVAGTFQIIAVLPTPMLVVKAFEYVEDGFLIGLVPAEQVLDITK